MVGVAAGRNASFAMLGTGHEPDVALGPWSFAVAKPSRSLRFTVILPADNDGVKPADYASSARPRSYGPFEPHTHRGSPQKIEYRSRLFAFALSVSKSLSWVNDKPIRW